MNDLKVLNQRYEAIAWGAILILLSILMFIPGDQNNVFLLGIGIILLGLNLVRRASQMAMNWFTVITGAIALALGALSLLWPVTGIKAHIEVDPFAILVLAIGLYLLIPSPKKELTG
jgi:hypothetical protein